jgi:hypothetical protein
MPPYGRRTGRNDVHDAEPDGDGKELTKRSHALAGHRMRDMHV